MRRAILGLGVFLLTATCVGADLCQVRVPDVAVLKGGEFVVPVFLSTDFSTPSYSFGIVHDPAKLRILSLTPGAAVAGFNDNTGPWYFQVGLYSTPTACGVDMVGGGTVACVTDSLLQQVIPAGLDQEIARITYAAEQAGESALSFRECLSDPVVGLRVVYDTKPLDSCRWVDAMVQVTTPVAGLRLADGLSVAAGEQFARHVLLDNAVATGVGGFEFAIAFTGVLLELTAIDYQGCPAMQALNGGAGPDYFEVTLEEEGWTCGQERVQGGAVACIVSNAWAETIPPGMGTPIANVTFVANAEGLPGITPIAIATEGCIPAGRAPRVRFTEQTAVTPAVQGTTAEVRAAKFIRGNANQDRAVDIADAVVILGYLFSHKAIDCIESADSNSSGAVDIADAIHVLSYLFARGATPQGPFPNCGLPVVYKLGCMRSDLCNE